MPAQIENKSANPSLDQLTLPFTADDGVTQKIPALHMNWAPRNNFGTYVSLVASGGRIKTGVELEEWKFDAELFRESMEFLLNCSHHEFWSYMVYKKSALAAVVLFLQRATPFYLDIWAQINDQVVDVKGLYSDILTIVMRIICRLITNKESPKDWISKEYQRELIYKNFLISVPMLFDLLSAVGDADEHNASMLRKIFDTLLRLEPNYKEDLSVSLNFFKTAFRSIQTQTENEGFEGAGGGELDDNTETPYDDVALYTLDCAYALSVLLDVCPEARSICDAIKLGHSIAHFYDSTIPFLYKNIFLINENAASLMWLNQARLQFLKTFRSISYRYVETVLMKPEDSLMPSENYIALLTECLSEQTFVIDYEQSYPVELDMDILKQACKDLDDFKASFVVKGYQKEAESGLSRTIGNIQLLEMQEELNRNNAQATKTITTTTSSTISKELPNVQRNDEVTNSGTTRDIDLEVTAVLDVLPHLGTGFVRRVLSRYENSEETIAAILEENLPPDLVNADQAEVYIPADPQDKLYQQTGIRHYNVFDGDAYDVMTHDNPSCIIKQGKGFPNAPQNAGQLLDDKSDLEKIRHRYQEYTLVSEGGDDNDDGEYDDEYDDSYEALLETETRVVRSKELKKVLADINDDEDDDDDDDDDDNDDNEEGRKGDKRINFCENPEDIRARYEAKRQAKWGNGGSSGGGGGGNRAGAAPPQARNVVGAPKGQGQDKETLRNRDKKEKNKSSRANHNRKAGAAFKRNKGMMG